MRRARTEQSGHDKIGAAREQCGIGELVLHIGFEVRMPFGTNVAIGVYELAGRRFAYGSSEAAMAGKKSASPS